MFDICYIAGTDIRSTTLNDLLWCAPPSKFAAIPDENIYATLKVMMDDNYPPNKVSRSYMSCGKSNRIW